MFDSAGKRYLTSNIAKSLSSEIKFFLWHLVDQRVVAGEELDYLQVFDLFIRGGKQVILHRQEQPLYKKEWIVEFCDTKPTFSTIWCMDNGEAGQIMLYPQDY